ncbi:MAG: response regulator transcription factor [Anaerolineales bacterium]
MNTYRALIVEDSIDVRRALKAALELLLNDFSVADVPSAEEGLLEFFRQPVDLLVTDFRLPGMTGFELMERMRAKKSDLKVIMVTGMPEPDYRRQALMRGADAFFYKPIEMADFVASVREIFQLPLPASTGAEVELPQLTLSELLAEQRQRFDARAVFLLDDSGRIKAQAGDYLAYHAEAPMVPMLMGLVSAARRVAGQLGKPDGQNVLLIPGDPVSFTVLPAGDGYVLLLVVDAKKDPPVPADHLYPVVDRLRTLLSELGADTVEPPAMEPEPAPPELPPEEFIDAKDPDLEALMAGPELEHYVPDDVDAFWENPEVQAPAPPAGSAEVLTYEQARRLGLTPDAE